MSGIARSIRFLVGVAMVAGGATLAAPVLTRLVTLAATEWGREGFPQPPAAPPPGPARALAFEKPLLALYPCHNLASLKNINEAFLVHK